MPATCKLLCILTIVSLGAAHDVEAEPVTIYVAPHGDDAATGTRDHPLATLMRARDAVRALHRAGQLPDGAEIIVRGGSYELTDGFPLAAADSGSHDAPIVYRASEGEEVRLIGGRSIPAKLFGLVTDKTLVDRLKPAAQACVGCRPDIARAWQTPNLPSAVSRSPRRAGTVLQRPADAGSALAQHRLGHDRPDHRVRSTAARRRHVRPSGHVRVP